MSNKQILTITVSPEEFSAIRSGERQELYRTATNEWFQKLYIADPKTGLVNVDHQIEYDGLCLKNGENSVLFTFKDLQVEEFTNQPEDSDERFGFVLVLGGEII
jgi:hypothetical protein